MHCNNGLNNKLVESLVENKVAQETGDLKYLQDSMYDFVKTLKEIILGEYSSEFFNKYVDEALKLHGSNLEEFLKIPKMGLELRQALESIDEAIDTSNQEFRDNLVLLLDRFQTTLDNMEYEARDPYDTAVELGFEGTKQEWLEHLEGDSAYKLATLNGFYGTEKDWLEHLEGDSAYKIAVDNGFVGTKQEWLTSLKPTEGTLQALSNFMNNDAETNVTVPELGNIPSLQGHIKQMFENGGLPATPFATKALMTASALVDGDYAQVTDDIDNNGLYVKTAGGWVKSRYDPLVQARAEATSQIVKTSTNLFNAKTTTAVIIDESTGIERPSDLVHTSDYITVTPSETYTISTSSSTSLAFYSIAHYDANKNFLRRLNTGQNGSLVLPSDVFYVRLVLNLSTGPSTAINRMFNAGSTALPYEPYYKLMSEDINFSSNQREEVKLIAESDEVAEVLRDKIGSISDYIVKSNNLFNAETATPVIIEAVTGNETPHESAFTSDYIKVTPNETYTSSGSSNTKLAFFAIACYDANKSYLRRAVFDRDVSTANGSFVIPSDVYYVRLIINRSTGLPTELNRMFNIGSTALPYEPYGESLQKDLLPSDIGAKRTVYVSKSGGPDGDGSIGKPLDSIQKAINLLQDSGEVVILDSGWYRESVNIVSNGLIKISSAKKERAKIIGSDQLDVSKTEGYTKVYQANLAKKPIGRWDGSIRGKPGIFEWGTPSFEIDPSEYHPLQRGFSHFLPYTQLFEVDSIADVENNNATWFWEDGVIYFSATDGGDATLKQYEARVRKTLKHNAGSLILDRIDTLFCVDAYGFHSQGASVVRYNCMSFGNYGGGFLDDAAVTVAYHDIAHGNGGDGIAAQTYNVVTTDPLMEDTTQAIYFDPWAAKNSDDGCSFHMRGTCTIFGGLMEYNVKGGVIHVSGGGGTCYNTISRGGHRFGFETGGAAVDGRTKSTLVCHNTTSVGNNYNYYAATGNVVLECHNTKSFDAKLGGYYSASDSKLVAYDCKNKGGPAKSGNVTVINSDKLT